MLFTSIRWTSPCCIPSENTRETGSRLVERLKLVSRGFYHAQIQQFLKFFPKEQLIVLNQADILKDIEVIDYDIDLLC